MILVALVVIPAMILGSRILVVILASVMLVVLLVMSAMVVILVPSFRNGAKMYVATTRVIY